MKKEKIELAITGVAIVLLIVVTASTFSKDKKKKTRSGSMPTAELNMFSDSEIFPAAKAKAESKKMDIKWGRDPFNLKKAGKVHGSLVLNGIIWDEVSPYAIVNDEVVKAGDTINGKIVVEITKNSITLDDNGEYLKLSIWEK